MRNLRFHRMVIGLVLLLTIDIGSAAAWGNRFHRRRCFLRGQYYEAAQTPVGGPAASPASPGSRRLTPRMSPAAEATSGQLPFVADNPEPRSTTYTVLLSNRETASCGPRGDDQGDQDLDFLKNPTK